MGDRGNVGNGESQFKLCPNRTSDDRTGGQPRWSRHAEVMFCCSHSLTFLVSLAQRPGSIWAGSNSQISFPTPPQNFIN